MCPGKSAAGKLREAEAESLKSFEIFKELLRTRKIGILHDPTNSWEPWTPNNANMCICLPLIGWLLEVQCLPDAFSFLIWIQFKNFQQVIASTSSGFIEAVGLIAIVDRLQFSEGNSPTSCVEPSAALTSKTGAGKEHSKETEEKDSHRGPCVLDCSYCSCYAGNDAMKFLGVSQNQPPTITRPCISIPNDAIWRGETVGSRRVPNLSIARRWHTPL